jgi:hypothetical protein
MYRRDLGWKFIQEESNLLYVICVLHQGCIQGAELFSVLLQC